MGRLIIIRWWFQAETAQQVENEAAKRFRKLKQRMHKKWDREDNAEDYEHRHNLTRIY